MRLLHDVSRTFDWFSANGGAHATVFLLIITAIYVFLTGHMAKTMARQTRAMIQPILSLKINWIGGEAADDHPVKGRLFIENQGSQPAVLLDVRLECVVEGKAFDNTFNGLDESIIAPQSSIGVNFDFEKQVQDANAKPARGVGWMLRVVTADVGRGVALEYIYWPVLTIRSCRVRYPLRVRVKYLQRSMRVRYHRIRRFVGQFGRAHSTSGR